MIVWKEEEHRILAMCGDLAIGAIFPSPRFVRWRIWVSKNMCPVDSSSRSVPAAKQEIEKRFKEFLQLAKLEHYHTFL